MGYNVVTNFLKAVYKLIRDFKFNRDNSDCNVGQWWSGQACDMPVRAIVLTSCW